MSSKYIEILYFVQKALEKNTVSSAQLAWLTQPWLAWFGFGGLRLSGFSMRFLDFQLNTKIEDLIFKNFIPETSQKLAETIAGYTASFTNAAAQSGSLALFFSLFLFFFLLNSIEHIFNSMMNAEKERTLIRKMSAYTLWSLGSGLTVLTLYLSSQMKILENFPLIMKLNKLFMYGLWFLFLLLPIRSFRTVQFQFWPHSKAGLWRRFYGNSPGRDLLIILPKWSDI